MSAEVCDNCENYLEREIAADHLKREMEYCGIAGICARPGSFIKGRPHIVRPDSTTCGCYQPIYFREMGTA